MKLKLNSDDIMNCPLMKKITSMDIKAGEQDLNCSLAKVVTPPKETSKGAEITSTYAKAGINIHNKTDEMVKNISKILEENYILDFGEHVHMAHYSSAENALRMRIGGEISGFKNLYNDNKRVCAYFNNEGKPDKVFILNNSTNEIDVYDCVSAQFRTYSKADVEALKYYKYHPDAIHFKIRKGKDIYSGSFNDEAERTVEQLRRLFQDKNKIFTTEQNTTLYRALQPDLSDIEMQNLKTIGAKFTEKSFCSTTRDLNVAKRFSSGNPILEIEFPKGSDYIDIEKIFNIDRQHWHEAEFLLDRNSQFIVTGFDKENNIIKVKYICS